MENKLFLPVVKLDESLGLVKVKVITDRENKTVWVHPDELVEFPYDGSKEIPKRGQLWRFKSTGKLWVVEDAKPNGGVRLVGLGCCKYYNGLESLMEVAEYTGRYSGYFEGLAGELNE